VYRFIDLKRWQNDIKRPGQRIAQFHLDYPTRLDHPMSEHPTVSYVQFEQPSLYPMVVTPRSWTIVYAFR
jgi:hypothetical protein